MPGDGILQLGATVDKTGVESGLTDINASVKTVVQNIAVQVEETTARTRAAWNKLGADVKASAATVSQESIKVAEATKAQAAALADLRRAQVLARDAKIGDAESTSILAAAQQKVASTTAAVVAAKEAEASAVVRATEQEVLGQNVLVAAFQRASLGVRESLTQIQEKLVETAETGRVSAAGIASGFSGLGALLGAGIAIGFAANFLDELAKTNVELDHLRAQSGIGITMLAGLQQIVEEMGGEWEPIATGLAKMNRALADSKEPSKELTDALAGIGLKIEDLRGLKPEEQLQKLAIAFAGTANHGNMASAAIAVFGRGGTALIPILREQGAALSENMRLQGEQTGITDKSAEAARRWTQDTARLADQFRAVLMPVMEHVEDVVRGVAGVFETAAAIIVSSLEFVATAVVSIYAPFIKLGTLMKDIFTGNWGQIKADAEAMNSTFVETWKKGFAEIKSNWREVANTFTTQSKVPSLPEGDFDNSIDSPAKGRKKTALQADEEMLAQMRLQAANKGYQLGLADEIEFWERRLRIAKKGSDEYNGIVSKLAGLKERALAELKSTSKPTDFAETVSVGLEGEADFSELRTNAEKSARDLKQAYRDAAVEKIRLAQEDRAQVERDTQFEVQMGRMSPQQRLQAIREAVNEEERIRVQQAQFLQALDMGDVRQYDQALRQEEQATREHAERIKQINQQNALATAQIWQTSFGRMSEMFSRNISMWISGQQSLSQTWARTLQGMTQTLVQNLLKQAIAFISHAATVDAVQQRQKLHDAAAAARKTYVSVAQIPVVGPFLAPAAAAAAFAAVEAFEQGGIVKGVQGGAVPILAHAGERVLSAQQTRNFETLVNTRTDSSVRSNTLNMGGLTQNFHGSRATPKEAAREMKDAIRRGRLRFA